MKRVNFDQLKNLEVPESLIDKALDIPNSTRKPFFFTHYQKIIGLAAALVIAVCVSLYMFFFTGGNSKIDFPTVATRETTEALQQDCSSGKTADPSSGYSAVPSVSQKGTDGGTAASASEPLEQKQEQTEASSDEKAAESSVENATEKSRDTLPGSHTETQTEGANTTAVMIDDPTLPEAPTAYPARCTLSCKIDSELFSGDAYCKLIGEDGAVLGSNNLFDSGHKAEAKDNGNGKTVLTYYVSEAEIKAAQGKMYAVAFYDGYGAVLKRSAMIYLFDNLYFCF